MLGKPGPFQIIESEGCGDVDAPIAAPRRRYECLHYTTCLNLAAALNWDSFTCRGCNAEIDEVLLGRARQAQKRDSVARSICECPPIHAHELQTTSSRQSHTGKSKDAGQSEDGTTTTVVRHEETCRGATPRLPLEASCSAIGAAAPGGSGQDEVSAPDEGRPVGAVVSLFGKRTV